MQEEKVAKSKKNNSHLVIPLRFFTYKVVIFFAEQYIEGSQASVDAGDVLLHINLILICEFRIAVYLLFQYAKTVAQHYDFVEEGFYWNIFWLEGLVLWL